MELYITALLNAGILCLCLVVFLVVAGFIGAVGWLISVCFFWLASVIGIKVNEVPIMDVKNLLASTYIAWFIVGSPLGYMAMTKVYTDLTEKKVERVKIVTQDNPEPYILVSQTTPKHYYVTLKHEKFGTIYERQYVSKHCNSYSDNKPGTVYNLRVQTWHYEDNPKTEYINFMNLVGEFCGSVK